MTQWVDYSEIKRLISIEQVIDRYGLELKKHGDALIGKCPLHNGEGEKAFNVSLSKKCFHCFSCGQSGNLIDFVAAMEKITFREAALLLKEWFLDGSGQPISRIPQKDLPKSTPKEAASALANEPLAFTLQLDPDHPYLASRGLTKETITEFGLGFCVSKSTVCGGRIAIPIHNESGELIAYAGRSISDEDPKYKLPARFQKSQVLFNYHRAIKAESGGVVIVVEGYFDCLKVWQAGFRSVVALMGSSLSDEQAELLYAEFSHVLLMLDGDTAGQDCAFDMLARLGARMWTRYIALPEGSQPDQLSATDLVSLLTQ